MQQINQQQQSVPNGAQVTHTTVSPALKQQIAALNIRLQAMCNIGDGLLFNADSAPFAVFSGLEMLGPLADELISDITACSSVAQTTLNWSNQALYDSKQPTVEG